MAHDPSLFAGGAALHALDEQEGAHFDEHLMKCPTCQVELTGFQETAALLGAASAEVAPASMRAEVLARIAITRQLPPQVSHYKDQQPAESGEGSAAPPPHTEKLQPFPDREPVLAEVVDISSRRRWSSRLLLSAAVAVVVAMVAVGAFLAFNKGTSSEDALRSCLQSSNDQHSAPAAADSVGVSKVTVSASCGAALVQLSSIPAAPSGHTYQLWVIAGGQARSVGTMLPDNSGTMPDVVAPVQVGDTALGVTVEPSGGSAAPTSPVLITVPLS